MKQNIPGDYDCRVRILRHRLSLTQEELAHHIGVSWVTVNRWENRKYQPSPLAWEKVLATEGIRVK